MKLRVNIANPAGNITVFVRDKIKKEDYIDIANKILNIKELGAEQVGYLMEATKDSDGKLEMMGGEFCGNASRSFGYLLAKEKTSKDKDTDKIVIESSGTEDLLEIDVNLKEETCSIELSNNIKIETFTLNGDQKYPIVIMEGINHIILENMKPDAEIIKNIIEKAKKDSKFDALGLMFTSGFEMNPVVYVTATDSIIHESSCGSGSIAYSCYMSNSKQEGEFKYSIIQPGGTIDVDILKNNGKIVSVTMGGKVEVTEIQTIEV